MTMTLMRRFSFAVIAFAFVVLSGAAAHACSSPGGVEGELIYSSDFKSVQYCDGANWIRLGSTLDPRIGAMTATKWCSSDGTTITCTQDAPAASAAGSDTQVIFNDGGTAMAGAAQLLWNKTDNRLRVGGTSSPTEALDVTGAATADRVILKPVATANPPSMGTQVWDSDGTHAWRTTGNVGVGTNGPSYKLHVTGGTTMLDGSVGINTAPSSGTALTITQTSTNTNAHGFSVTNEPVATASGAYSGYSSMVYLYPRISNGITNSSSLIASNVQGLRTYADDRGTLTSLYGVRIQYGHNTSATGNPTTTNAFGLYLYPYQATGTITNNYTLYIGSPVAGGTVTNNYGIYQASTAQRNYLAGRLGVGITNPSQSIETSGNISLSTGGYLYGSDSSSANYLGLLSSNSLTNGGSVITYGRTHASAAGQVRIYTATNTNDTTSMFTVYKRSTADVSTTLLNQRSNGNMYVYGDYTCIVGAATTVSCSSDRRLKDGIAPMDSALDSLVRLQPVTFHLKDKEKSQRTRMGFIAQDVQAVYPQAIDTDDESGYLTMDYGMLTAPLVAAVKELNVKRLALEEKVNAQGAEIDSLKARLDALERKQ